MEEEDSDSDCTVLLTDFVDKPQKVDAKRRRLSQLQDRSKHADQHDENTARNDVTQNIHTGLPKKNIEKKWLINRYLSSIYKTNIRNNDPDIRGNEYLNENAPIPPNDSVICLDSDDKMTSNEKSENQDMNKDETGTSSVNDRLHERKLIVLKPAVINARRATIDVIENNQMLSNDNVSQKLKGNEPARLELFKPSTINARRATTHFEENNLECNSSNGKDNMSKNDKMESGNNKRIDKDIYRFISPKLSPLESNIRNTTSSTSSDTNAGICVTTGAENCLTSILTVSNNKLNIDISDSTIIVNKDFQQDTEKKTVSNVKAIKRSGNNETQIEPKRIKINLKPKCSVKQHEDTEQMLNEKCKPTEVCEEINNETNEEHVSHDKAIHDTIRPAKCYGHNENKSSLKNNVCEAEKKLEENILPDKEEISKVQYKHVINVAPTKPLYQNTNAKNYPEINQVPRVQEMCDRDNQDGSKMQVNRDANKKADKLETSEYVLDKTIANKISKNQKTSQVVDETAQTEANTEAKTFEDRDSANEALSTGAIKILDKTTVGTTNEAQESTQVQNELKTIKVQNRQIKSIAYDKHETNKLHEEQRTIETLNKEDKEEETRQVSGEQTTTESNSEQETDQPNKTRREVSLNLGAEEDKRILAFQVFFFTYILENIIKDEYPEFGITLKNIIETLRNNARHGIFQTHVQYDCPKCGCLSNYSSNLINRTKSGVNKLNSNGSQNCRLCRGVRELHTSYLEKHFNKKDHIGIKKEVESTPAEKKLVKQKNKSLKQVTGSNSKAVLEENDNNDSVSRSVEADRCVSLGVDNEKQADNISSTQSALETQTGNHNDSKEYKINIDTPFIETSESETQGKIKITSNNKNCSTEEVNPVVVVSNSGNADFNRDVSSAQNDSNTAEIASSESPADRETHMNTTNLNIQEMSLKSKSHGDNIITANPDELMTKSDNTSNEVANEKPIDPTSLNISSVGVEEKDKHFEKKAQMRNADEVHKPNENITISLKENLQLNNNANEEECSHVNTQEKGKTLLDLASKESFRTDKLISGATIAFKYICPHCTSTYTHPSKFLRHLKNKHNARLTKIPENCIRQQCPFCNYLLFQKSYNKHVARCRSEMHENTNINKGANENHSKIKNVRACTSGKNEQVETSESITFKYFCSICNETLTTDYAAARQHRTQFHPEFKHRHIIKKHRIGINNEQEEKQNDDTADPVADNVYNSNPNCGSGNEASETITTTAITHQTTTNSRNRKSSTNSDMSCNEDEECESDESSSHNDNSRKTSETSDEEDDDKRNENKTKTQNTSGEGTSTDKNARSASKNRTYTFICELCNQMLYSDYARRKHRILQHPNMQGRPIFKKIKNVEPKDNTFKSKNERKKLLKDNNSSSSDMRRRRRRSSSSTDRENTDSEKHDSDWNSSITTSTTSSSTNERSDSQNTSTDESNDTDDEMEEDYDSQKTDVGKSNDDSNFTTDEENLPVSNNKTLNTSMRTSKKRKQRLLKFVNDSTDTDETDSDQQVASEVSDNELLTDPNYQCDNNEIASKNFEEERLSDDEIIKVSAQNNDGIEQQPNNETNNLTNPVVDKLVNVRDDQAQTRKVYCKTNDRDCNIDPAIESTNTTVVSKQNNTNELSNVKLCDDDRHEIDLIDCLLKEYNTPNDQGNDSCAEKEKNGKDNTEPDIHNDQTGANIDNQPLLPPEINNCLEKIQIINVRSIANKLYIFICQECSYATDTYDDTIRHCQNHFNLIEDPVTYCNICQIKYDSSCFERHEISHDKYLINIKIKFSYQWLFSNWQDVFENNHILLGDAEDMQVQSIYKTHCVKMTVKEQGPWQSALYLCAKCNIFVPPSDIEKHLQEKCTLTYYACPICHRKFLMHEMREHHKIYHTDEVTQPFKTIVFNEKKDELFNSTLIKIKLQLTQNKEKRLNVEIYKCICGLCFITLKQFKLHFVDCESETNDGVQCTKCLRRFLPSDLEIHMSLHHSAIKYEFKVQKIAFQEEHNSSESLGSTTDNNVEDLNIKNEMLKDETLSQGDINIDQDDSEILSSLENAVQQMSIDTDSNINRQLTKDELLSQNTNDNIDIVEENPIHIMSTVDDVILNRDLVKEDNSHKTLDISEENLVNKSTVVNATQIGSNVEDLNIKQEMLKNEVLSQNTIEKDIQECTKVFEEHLETIGSEQLMVIHEDLNIKKEMLKEESFSQNSNAENSQERRDAIEDNLGNKTATDSARINFNNDDLITKKDMLKDITLSDNAIDEEKTEISGKPLQNRGSTLIRLVGQVHNIEGDMLKNESTPQNTNKDNQNSLHIEEIENNKENQTQTMSSNEDANVPSHSLRSQVNNEEENLESENAVKDNLVIERENSRILETEDAIVIEDSDDDDVELVGEDVNDQRFARRRPDNSNNLELYLW
ncbi:MATH and LRR domain-containing protein PFE0570w-like [Cydia fagiglandana]|uniref:MATH and LRR domain-containing protein PFE0570w-like n=2 Tax=Cydia fagiglandana TaxID=1458189 RepID=UPI002FEE3747